MLLHCAKQPIKQLFNINNNIMIVSIAEEMNPTRRNTMEDVHVAHPPGSWGAPDENAIFLGVYDGHGGRLIADYLEDHLAENVAKEWEYSEGEHRKTDGVKGGDGSGREGSKKRRLGNDNDGRNNDENSDNYATKAKSSENEMESKIIQVALERAFLLTDMQSRMDGIKTSGATVVCCVVVPKFDSSGRLSSITIHSANAGDARAVLSSSTARPLQTMSSDNSGNTLSKTNNKKSQLPSPELPNELPIPRSTRAVRITHDHKSTDPKEVARIEASGGIMMRGRVLGVLAVARSLGDHGLKEYVIGRPYLSSKTVRIVDDHDSNDDNSNNIGQKQYSQSMVKSPPFTDGEFLIVACDGLWDVMKDQDAVDFVRNNTTAMKTDDGKLCTRKNVASFLIEEALRRGSTDNITVIVYWL